MFRSESGWCGIGASDDRIAPIRTELLEGEEREEGETTCINSFT